MAQWLQVSKSGYYAWRKRPKSPHCTENESLLKEIIRIQEASHGIYGGRKITYEINRKSEKPVNHKRVERIMRENGIRSKSHKKYKATTNSRHGLPVAVDKETLINNLLANYGKYGVTRAELEPIIDDGIQNYDLSLEVIYSGLRMSLASAFNEHEYFSLDDVMAITGESREELLQRIEQCRQELIEAGESPDEYFKPVEPQRAAVYYFPNGLH